MNRVFNIVLFAYNFSHRKTIDFIKTLYKNQYKVSLIIAANHIYIKSPRSRFKFKSYQPQETISELVKMYGIPFHVSKHNSEKTKLLIQKYKINFGIISGARIINCDIINCIKYGILNFHPGLLPIIRGLDSILWSIYYDQNIGVTAHLISKKIDSGFLVYQEKIKVCIDDDIYSLYEKNYQLQLKLIPISLNLITEKQDFKLLEHNGPYNTKMSYLKQLDVVEIIDQYINRYSKIDEKN